MPTLKEHLNFSPQAKSGSEADLENALGSTSAQRDAMNKLSVVKHSSEIDEQHKSLSVRLASTISTIRRENIFGNKLGSDLPGETPPIVKQAWDVSNVFLFLQTNNKLFMTFIFGFISLWWRC